MLVALQVGVTARGDDGVVHGMRRSSRAQAERRRSEEELRAAVWFARDHGVTWERIGEILEIAPLEAARALGASLVAAGIDEPGRERIEALRAGMTLGARVPGQPTGWWSAA